MWKMGEVWVKAIWLGGLVLDDLGATRVIVLDAHKLDCGAL